MRMDSKKELSDLLFRRMLCEVKLVKAVAIDTDIQDYRDATVDACERVIRTMELKDGGPKMASLRRKL